MREQLAAVDRNGDGKIGRQFIDTGIGLQDVGGHRDLRALRRQDDGFSLGKGFELLANGVGRGAVEIAENGNGQLVVGEVGQIGVEAFDAAAVADFSVALVRRCGHARA